MSASRHYAKAQHYLAEAERHLTEDPGDMRIAEVAAWIAHGHALLAAIPMPLTVAVDGKGIVQ